MTTILVADRHKDLVMKHRHNQAMAIDYSTLALAHAARARQKSSCDTRARSYVSCLVSKMVSNTATKITHFYSYITKSPRTKPYKTSSLKPWILFAALGITWRSIMSHSSNHELKILKFLYIYASIKNASSHCGRACSKHAMHPCQSCVRRIGGSTLSHKFCSVAPLLADGVVVLIQFIQCINYRYVWYWWSVYYWRIVTQLFAFVCLCFSFLSQHCFIQATFNHILEFQSKCEQSTIMAGK